MSHSLTLLIVLLLAIPASALPAADRRNLPAEERLSCAIEDQDLINAKGRLADVRHKGPNRQRRQRALGTTSPRAGGAGVRPAAED